MKKLTITLMLLLMALAASAAEISFFKTESVRVDFFDGKGYSKELPVESVIAINYDKNIITIDDIEIFFVSNIYKYEYDKYELLKCVSLDMDGNNCVVELYLYEKNFYMKVIYPRFIYKYKVNY